MTTIATPQTNYELGHSEPEMERLTRQAQAFERFTRQFFQEAGLGPGMRVLDIGSGAGDVAFLAADLVGSAGEVIGVDRSAGAVQWSARRANSLGIANVRFLEGDPSAMEFERPFDAVVGRLVLMFQPNPADVLRKLTRHLRPGAIVAFQEFDVANARSFPAAPTFDRALEWIRRTQQTAGARLEMGLDLYPTYLAAGLPGPSLRMDALIAGGADSPAYGMITDVIRSLLPAMERMKIATAAEIGIDTIEQRMRDEVVAGKGVILSPALIGAWARRP
jgi:SAM-dependent methyltransferase